MSNMSQDNYYDYVVVGAGVSGLYTAHELYKKYPSASICVLEATAYIGGRLHSIKYDGLIMDGGGARFNTDQHRIVSLIKELNLWDKVIPIKTDSTYKPVNDTYKSLAQVFPTIDEFIKYMKKYIKDNNIKRDTLVNTTIIEFAEKHFIKEYPNINHYLINIYPYYSELIVLNALESINLFSNELSEKTNYFILNGGLEQITETLYNKLKKLKQNKNCNNNKCNIDIYKETPVLEIKHEQNDIGIDSHKYIIKTDNMGSQASNEQGKIFTAKNIIITIPKNKLIKIKFSLSGGNHNNHTKLKEFKNNINSVQNEPLYRIYARYPLDKKTNKVWFDGMGKIVTDLPIKYIIPNNYKKGVIMISYTDSKFARYWVKQVADGTFETTLNKQLKQLFPDIDIPKAKWYKHCPWVSGAGYWKKGYDRKVIMPKMIQPLGSNENIYICGENYSSHQAWVEGSLETSEMVLDKLDRNRSSQKEKTKTIKKVQNINNVTKVKNMKNMNINKVMKGGKTKKNTKLNTKEKEYTLEEVAKHNTKSDAWIVIHGKVANITNWIPKHPGGDIIMKGVGKDATTLFNSIGHDDYAKKMLKQYQIGILKK